MSAICSDCEKSNDKRLDAAREDALKILLETQPTKDVTVTEQKQSDDISAPSHYTWLPGIECTEVVSHFSFHLGSAIKYIWRAGRKDINGDAKAGKIKDLRKAIKNLQLELMHLGYKET